uniref:non-specific serine/threonine protein kinase n=3 Tax=Clastoptera arizonana TaxID=38151 RepID=A0A1B6CK79_9HEMI
MVTISSAVYVIAKKPSTFMKVKSNPREIDKIVTKYIALKTSTAEVREKMASSLQRFINHIQELNYPQILDEFLPFMDDEDEKVRQAFSKVACYLIFPKIQKSNVPPIIVQGGCNEVQRNFEKFIKISLPIIHRSLRSNDRQFLKLQLTLMATLYNVGCVPEQEVLLPIIKLFIYIITHPNTIYLIFFLAQTYLKGIASVYNQTIQDLFYKFQDQICEVIVASLVQTFISEDPSKVEYSLLRIARSFGFVSVEDLMNYAFENYFLKYLLPWSVKIKQTEELLNVINNTVYQRDDISGHIENAFKKIYPHVFLFENFSVATEVCKKVSQLTKLSLKHLVCFSSKVIICELFINIYDKKEKVKQVLIELKKVEIELDREQLQKSLAVAKTKSEREEIEKELKKKIIEEENNIKTDKDIATFIIQPRFLGILAYLDEKLISSSECESVKKKVLLALPCLINIMTSERVTPVKYKVLATLRSALNIYKNQFPEYIFDAFLAFVENVDPVSLGPLMSTICVCLLPVINEFPVAVGNIFTTMIIKNIDAVSLHLADLHFIPDLPSTHDIYNLIQRKVQEQRCKPFKEQLKYLLHQACHENTDVRLHGLKKLLNELVLNRRELHSLDFKNDPNFIKLVGVLIAGARVFNDDILLACGECLGEIGALDPGHLKEKMVLCDDGKKDILKINSDIFVTKALMELARALQASSHCILMDKFALAIQELLKIYDIPKSRPNVWNQLTETTKEIIHPLFSSRYINNNPRNSKLTFSGPHPLFGNVKKYDFLLWAVPWANRLIDFVKEELAMKVFTVCKFGFKSDKQTLMFFLPYILLYALFYASERELQLIKEEINAVLFWSKDKPIHNKRISERTIKNVGYTSVAKIYTLNEETRFHKLCTKTVFELLDFIDQWWRQVQTKKYDYSASIIKNVEDFLKSCSRLDFAQIAFNNKDYTRALIYLEKYLQENPEKLQENLSFLGKIYSALNEPDGFKGVFAKYINDPSLEDMILYHEVTNQLQDATVCYEQLLRKSTSYTDFHKAMVQCYLKMDQPGLALKVVDGLRSSWDDNSEFLDEEAEAMLSLSRYDELENLLSKKRSHRKCGWGLRLGQSLLHLRKGEGEQMLSEINSLRIDLVRALSTTCITECEYRQGYDNIVKLHVLNEFEKLGTMIMKIKSVEGLKSEKNILEQYKQLINEDFSDRLKLIHLSYRVLDPILRVRRVLLSIAHQMFQTDFPTVGNLIFKEIGQNWLKSIELAIKSKSYQQAYSNILNAEDYQPKGMFIEKAKLLWSKEDTDAAINTLHRGIDWYFPNLTGIGNSTDVKLCAKAKLLIAIYNDKNVNKDYDQNLKNYSAAVKVFKFWEKSIKMLAQYEYKVLRKLSDTNNDDEQCKNIRARLINNFGKSLEYGCKYVYQSVPRMLSVWLDYGTDLIKYKNTCDKETFEGKVKHMSKLTEIIESFMKRLPRYIFMTSFSQLISCICHPYTACFNVLKKTIIYIIEEYPQQALWMFISAIRSMVRDRKSRSEEILGSSRLLTPELSGLIENFKNLANNLCELANIKVQGGSYLIQNLYPPLQRFVNNNNAHQILIPLQKFRTIALPRSSSMYQTHRPFPMDLVYICGMKDEVQVVPSLQKPKRIALKGTDGQYYHILCKPKDDLRLDARMMELCSIINLYLNKDPEARIRGLHIRTYSAVPLTDDCGLIEWIPNLKGLRPAIIEIYKRTSRVLKTSELQSLLNSDQHSLETKRDIFVNKVLREQPSVLQEWFLDKFHSPTEWYLARSAYVKTTAVMSIVGNIVGLGDRHGENVLLDLTCGDLIHVDFGCLFNKGDSLQFPELVPFRLTHNMVSAMGPTGVEGMFRLSCEITTRIMRQQIDQLMSLLQPFLYDSLATLNSKTTKNKRVQQEMTFEKCREVIQNIDMRLQGAVKKPNISDSCLLSVEGQVDYLIKEATSIDNLCQMFLGWGPYL